MCQWLHGPQQIKGSVGRLGRRHIKILPPLPSMPGVWHLHLGLSKAGPQGTLVKQWETKILRDLLPSCSAHYQPKGCVQPSPALTGSIILLSRKAGDGLQILLNTVRDRNELMGKRSVQHLQEQPQSCKDRRSWKLRFRYVVELENLIKWRRQQGEIRSPRL